MDIEDNKILNELYTTLEDLENEVYNLSTENAIFTNNINLEDIVKRQNQRKSTMIFGRIFKNYKFKYKEDENMKHILIKYLINMPEKKMMKNLLTLNFLDLNLKLSKKINIILKIF